MSAGMSMDGCTSLTASASLPSADWIPFEGGETGLLNIPIRICGIETRAILDSGATRLIVDADFATRLGLKPGVTRRVAGLTGEASGKSTLPLEIWAGSTRLPRASALLLDLGPIVDAAATPFDVVLGHELFLGRTVDIDPDRRCVRFLNNGGDNISNWLPVVQTPDGLFCTTITLGGGLRVDAVIDLGCMSPLYISPDVAERHHLFDGAGHASSASMGVEGLAISRLGRLAELQLAGALLRDIPFSVPPTWNFAAPVVLGLPVLMRFRTLLDFGRARMQLTPGGNFDRLFDRDRSGLSVRHRGDRLEIIHVSKHGPAVRAGLVAGDSILAVNHEAVSRSTVLRHRNLGKHPAGTRYVLSLPMKGSRDLVLEDYY